MDDSWRQLAATASVLAYGALCAAIWQRERRRAQALVADAASLAAAGEPMLVLHATQTGQAEAIAWQTARWLHAGGAAVRVMSLNELDLATLQAAPRALFVASTYGEGDAPDGASAFVERIMEARAQLPGLRYALLALGDRQYAHFCGFGRRLDGWLRDSGAVPAFARIDVDNGDDTAMALWREQWQGQGEGEGAGNPSEAAPGDAFRPWRLVARRQLNAGSAGAPVFHLAFAPSSGALPHWASGDLAQIRLASDPQRPRDYSIASIPADGELQLLVRQEQHPDGTLGAASGLLTADLAPGDAVPLRLRPHGNFRLNGNADRPLVLIGNGTGLAGLRSHLRERVARGLHDNWLVFGERSAQHDFLYRDELEGWVAAGALARLDMMFSRDEESRHGERRYVQHRLFHAADELRAWVDRGAALYVCGSLQGMASGVDTALRQILGRDRLHEIAAAGRYRRDVY
ncbi:MULTISPECIES: sulfite reductase subunit alpha [unclassified Variovorax]|uniref:sulfite reductase subunit alpha n=1 Tax=unclassified Variovorax TaxID=663243 RepID=UPI00076C5E47|nr:MULTISPECIES: sulfite reductase subunit alpha [unclassified Variovorax]KWT69933.1 putative iron-regulated membrane protein [Variovorax sp. WDL1]PNG46691.1 Sulfite reductase [NADPH] flavoprotein alpha-component [Variovorax sp. B2]PNG48658.1 Sulfite reductase [NADPH] flavoprotein alpha-component [Variovorax sp. B4]VTV14481.1 Sulfite reductase [NADPH] flavoprotein alpha-component [Variovorax sp. WDL1]